MVSPFDFVNKELKNDVGTIVTCTLRYFLKASAYDSQRSWVWKTILSVMPLCLALGQFSRLNHGAHLGLLIAVVLGLASLMLAAYALWYEHGQATKLKAAQEAHSQFLAATETSLDAFSILECLRNDAREIIDFRILYVNANAERLAGRSRSELVGQMLCKATPMQTTKPMFAKFCKVVESGEPLNEEFPVDIRPSSQSGYGARWLSWATVLP